MCVWVERCIVGMVRAGCLVSRQYTNTFHDKQRQQRLLDDSIFLAVTVWEAFESNGWTSCNEGKLMVETVRENDGFLTLIESVNTCVWVMAMWDLL